MEDLKKEIQLLIKEVKGYTAVYIKDLDTGDKLMINEKEKFHAASLIKVPILIEAMKKIEEGFMNLKDIAVLEEEDKVGGCGVLPLFHEGLVMTIEDLLYLMIDISDNTATNILIDHVGIDDVNEGLKKAGLQNTYFARKLMKVIPGLYNYTTAEDMGKLFEKLYKGELLEKELTEKTFHILFSQQMNDRLSQQLYCCGKCSYWIKQHNYCPKCGSYAGTIDKIKTKFAHKTGEIIGVVHDAGIMYIKEKAVVTVVLTKELESNREGYQLLSHIGNVVFDYFQQ